MGLCRHGWLANHCNSFPYFMICVSLCAYSSQVLLLLLAAALLQYQGEIFLCVSSLIPRPQPAFHCLQYGKSGKGLASFLM